MGRPPLRAVVWAAAALALLVTATLLWRGSAAAATDSTTARPAGIPQGTPAGAVSAAWAAPTRAAPPSPVVHEGRVVVLGQHGVRALDVHDGAEAWRYTRADAVLCDATPVDGLVVAVFRTADRCDEAVALSVATGVRAWNRNVDFRPDVRLTGSGGVVLAAAPTGVATLDPVGSTLRWRRAAEPGCTFTGAEVGDAGVALLQRCPGTATQRLHLLDGDEGGELWVRDVPDGSATLAGVDRLVAVAAVDHVTLHAAGNGLPLARTQRPEGDGPVLVSGSGDVLSVFAGGQLTVVDRAGGAARWAVPAAGLPAAPVEGPAPGGGPATVAALPVPEAGGVVLRDLETGAEVARHAGPDLPPGGTATVVGPVVVHHLPGRITVFGRALRRRRRPRRG